MDIEQKSTRLRSVVQSAVEGKLAPGAYPHPYAWSREDVEMFWRSLVNEWPVGTIVIWHPERALDPSVLSSPRLGPYQLAPEGRFNVLLDGLNRVAAYAWTMRTPQNRLPFDLLTEAEAAMWDNDLIPVLDPQAGSIRMAEPQEIFGSRFVLPLGYAAPELLHQFMSHREGQIDIAGADFSWCSKVAQTIREARCATIHLERCDPVEALEAFRHIGRTGRKLTDADFEASLPWANAPGALKP